MRIFLYASICVRWQFHTLTDIKESDTFRAIKLVRGSRKKIYSQLTNIDFNISLEETANCSILRMFSSIHLHRWAGTTDAAQAKKVSLLFCLTTTIFCILQYSDVSSRICAA